MCRGCSGWLHERRPKPILPYQHALHKANTANPGMSHATFVQKPCQPTPAVQVIISIKPQQGTNKCSPQLLAGAKCNAVRQLPGLPRPQPPPSLPLQPLCLFPLPPGLFLAPPGSFLFQPPGLLGSSPAGMERWGQRSRIGVEGRPINSLSLLSQLLLGSVQPCRWGCKGRTGALGMA